VAFCFFAFPLLFAFPASSGAWGKKDAPFAPTSLPSTPAAGPVWVRDLGWGTRGAEPRRGRPPGALWLEGGGKAVPSPPPRLPVAQGAFLRSYPRRTAKRADPSRVLLSRE
jgi:hypothetical protein